MSDQTAATIAEAVARNRALVFPAVPLTIGCFTGDVGEPQQPSLLPRRSSAIATTTALMPWQPVKGSADNTVAINPDSQLLKDDFTRYLVTNRTADFTLTTTNYLLYLELSYTTGVLSSVVLKKGPEWTDYPDKVIVTGSDTLGDPYVVTKTRLVIAYAKLASDTGSPAGCMTVTDGADVLKVIPCVQTSLALAIITTPIATFEYPECASLIPIPPP